MPVHKFQPLWKFRGQLRIVRNDDQDGLLAAMQVQQHPSDSFRGGAVEVSRGLVTEQQPRLAEQRRWKTMQRSAVSWLSH